MDTNFQKVKNLIKESDISVVEQIELILLFYRAEDKDLEYVSRLFMADLSWIRKISDNYKAKQSALTVNDSTLWQKIIEEEKCLLEALK